MKNLSTLMIPMMMGIVLSPPLPGLARQGSTPEPTPQVQENISGRSADIDSKDPHMKKKRRSSGKQIVEDTGNGGSQPGKRPSQQDRDATPGTTLKFGSGGSGVTGATGK